MISTRTISTFLVLFALSGANARVSGDLIILTNGDRLDGRVTQEGEHTLHVEVRDPETGVLYVRRLARNRVARVERGAVQSSAPRPDSREVEEASSAAVATSETAPPSAAPAADRALKPRDIVNLLETAIEHWNAARYEPAALALTRVITNSPRADLAIISRDLESRLGMPLADLASTARLRAARLHSGNGTLRLRHVTRYERDAMAARLKAAYEQALVEPVSLPAANQGASLDASGTNNATQPANAPATRPSAFGMPVSAAQEEARTLRTYVLQEWLDKFERRPEVREADLPPRRPEEAEGHLRHLIEKLTPTSAASNRTREKVVFDGSREEAYFFAQHIRYAYSLLRERLRYDADLRRRSAERKELQRERSRLQRLLKAVEARAEGALTPEEEERLRFQRQRMVNIYRRQMEEKARARNARFNEVFEKSGAEPGAVRQRTIQIEGEVVEQPGSGGRQRKLEARIVPDIPPELLQDGAMPAEDQPAETLDASADRPQDSP